MSKKILLILSLLTLCSCDQYIEIKDSNSSEEISSSEVTSSSEQKTTEENVSGLPWL